MAESTQMFQNMMTVLEIVQKLFGGVMGNTFLVMLKTTGKLYVMKRVDYLDEKDKMKADEEVEQIRRLSSKFT
ncbi:MAG: hypothetical protein EZS28_046220, partial [Streblomastix strix]